MEGRVHNVRVSGIGNTVTNTKKNIGSSDFNFNTNSILGSSHELNINLGNSSADSSTDMEIPAITSSSDAEGDDDGEGVNIVRHVHIAGDSHFDQNEVAKLRLHVQELTKQNQILCKHILELEQKNFQAENDMKKENESNPKEAPKESLKENVDELGK